MHFGYIPTYVKTGKRFGEEKVRIRAVLNFLDNLLFQSIKDVPKQFTTSCLTELVMINSEPKLFYKCIIL